MRSIKSYAAAVAATLIIFALAASYTAAESTLIGDVDGDGVVTVMDATAIQNVLARRLSPYSGYAAVGDVDTDGEVTIADATLIQRYVAKMIPSLPFNNQIPATSPTDADGWGHIIIRP